MTEIAIFLGISGGRLFGLIDRPWVVPPDGSHFLPVLPVTIYEMDEANI